jgi:hypothetical protein
MNDTPTPRTDANDLGWQFNEQYGDFDSLSDNPMPWLDFAKMLERELAAATEQRDRLAKACDQYSEDEMLGKLQEITKQRDRLAEALDKVVDAWDHAEWLDENDFESFRAALQSLPPKP